MEGRTIGDYKVVETVWQTPYTCLYKAVEQVEGQEEGIFYALKRLPFEGVQELTLQKEKVYTQQISNSTRENIVIPILKVIGDGKAEYAVMQFVHHGLFLEEVIDQLETGYGAGQIPIGIQLQVLGTILRALKMLHRCGSNQNGFLHMDLHPGNIFLENCRLEQGTFGAARFLDLQNALPMDANGMGQRENGLCGGCIGFVAPEQLRQRQNWFRKQTDLYAVAAIGARLFTGVQVTEPFQTYLDILEEMPDPKGQNRILVYQMRSFLKLGLDANPRYRMETAREMLRQVRRLQEMVRMLQAGDYYGLFLAAYEEMVPVEWLQIDASEYQQQGLVKAVTQLRLEMDRQDHDMKQTSYLFRGLWQMKERDRELLQRFPRTFYTLIKCGVESYNFLGDSMKAIALFDEVERNRAHILLKEYLGLINLAAESYVDTYRYEDAYQLMDRNRRTLDAIKDCYKKAAVASGLYTEDATRIKERGDAYCAWARYQVFLGIGNPMEAFAEAYSEYEEGSDERAITVSHILHYAVEQRDRELFACYGAEYLHWCPAESKSQMLQEQMAEDSCGWKEFESQMLQERRAEDSYGWKENGDQMRQTGCSTLGACLQYLLYHQVQTAHWRLWVFLKGVYFLYRAEIPADTWLLTQLEQLVRQQGLQSGVRYPAELIYEYAGLILYEGAGRQVTDVVTEAFVLALQYPESEQIRSGGPLRIRRVMKYQIQAQYNQIRGREEDNALLYRQLLRESMASGWTQLTKKLQSGADLPQLLGYEHC